MATNSTVSVCKGDILLVDFKKNEGSEQNGLRPAIVVQNDTGNMFAPTTIVCPLTSQNKRTDVTHVILFPEDCGILEPSVILCEQIRVIDKSRIRRKVGRLVSPRKLEEIDKKILMSVGIMA